MVKKDISDTCYNGTLLLTYYEITAQLPCTQNTDIIVNKNLLIKVLLKYFIIIIINKQPMGCEAQLDRMQFARGEMTGAENVYGW